jgi:RNA 3'-terminal phosphate cyclase
LGSERHRDELSPGEVAAKEILKPLLTGACIDDHMQDQVRHDAEKET